MLAFQGIPAEPLPAPPALQNIGPVALTQQYSFLHNATKIGKRHRSVMTRSMEYYGQNFGFILYHHDLKGPYEASKLFIDGLADRAYVYVNGQLRGMVYRNDKKKFVSIEALPDGGSLDILVEAMGRVNYGPELTRNLRVDHITKRQAILETVVTTINDFFVGLLGESGKRYVPYLMSVALYIGCSNLIGVFGIKPPTKDLNVTAALALMSICLIEYAGIHARGGVGFLKSLAAPTPIMAPMNVLEVAIRPTSLCMRLFGNVLGAFVIMELIKLVVPVFVPAIFSLYFDLFDGLIQTYVFVFLTSLFMKETMGDEE